MANVEANEHDYALVIGIEYYPLLQADLPGAHEDARQFRKWLVDAAGLPDSDDHIKVVLGEIREGDDPRPAQQQIDKAFRGLLTHAKAAGGGRRLYVYFAGHGGATEQRHVALLLADASVDFLNSAMDSALYHEGLAMQATFPEQVIFYDCCRNFDGRFTGRGPDWSKLSEEELKTNAAALSAVQQWVLYAAGFTQYANRREIAWSVRRGLFTEALLEGLNGKAARADGRITMISLADFVKTRLEELTRPLGISQELGWNPAGRYDDLVLLSGVAVSRTLVEVRVPTGTNRVLVADDLDNFTAEASVQDGVARLELAAGIHIFRIDPAPSEGRAMRALNIPVQANFIVQF